MTDQRTLIALAERCEKAKGPDRELDRAIADAIRPPARPHVADLDAPPPGFGRGFMEGDLWGASYTASIDAAMSLVPEVWGNVGTYPWLGKQKAGVWQAGVSAPGNEKRPPVCYARTAALALTAASLRALAAQAPRP